jgi:HAD superfamily hydrolase (TIGR01509 family)
MNESHSDRIGGMVFDLDGTIVDNMPIHVEAFAVFASRHGLPPLTLADRARLDGKRNRDIFPVLFGRVLTPVELATYSEEKESLYRERSKGRLVPLRGLTALLSLAAARGIPVVVATSAPLVNVTHTLAELGLAAAVPHVVRGDEVARGKPFPDVFLAAAAMIGVAAEACVAFEDAPIGIEAARRAGMKTAAVTTSFSAASFLAADVPPTWIVGDFEEFLRGPGAWLAA